MYFLQQALPEAFFTPGSLATLAGCTGIVFVVSSGIQRPFNYNPKWLALLLSILVSLFGAYLAQVPQEAHTVIHYSIALLNGFLIYASATGTNQILGHKRRDAAVSFDSAPANRQPRPVNLGRGFLTRWF